jgi:hypothetical protein
MTRNKRKRKNKRSKRKRTRRPNGNARVAMVTSYDGTPVDACSCPICMDMAKQGIQIVNERGEAIQMPDVATIEVRVRGTVSTWPELDTDWQTVEVPAGCVLMDMLEYLCMDPQLRAAFPPGGLSGSVNSELGEDMRVLMPGDSIIVSGERDARWTEMMEKVLVPMTSFA